MIGACILHTSTSHTPWASLWPHSHGANYLGVGQGAGHHCIMTKYGNTIAVWLCELPEECNLTYQPQVLCVYKLESNPQIPASRMMKCCTMLRNTCTLPVCCSTRKLNITTINVMSLFLTCMSRHQHSLCFSMCSCLKMYRQFTISAPIYST